MEKVNWAKYFLKWSLLLTWAVLSIGNRSQTWVQKESLENEEEEAVQLDNIWNVTEKKNKR